MTARSSLGADYFEGIFTFDDDPWNLASSDYERRKFDRTIAVLEDRRYGAALEVGCAHGVLTARLQHLCDDLLAIDISKTALRRAKARLADQREVQFKAMAFPCEAPTGSFDLCLLSEVAYYWGPADLALAGRWMANHLVPGGRALLVHYTGATDYPCTGDEAVTALEQATADCFTRCPAERHDGYRLDLWERL